MDEIPVVGSWEWMSPEQQIEHLHYTHGFNADWFEARGRGHETWDEADDRDEWHENDHADYDYGGGRDHKHSLTHPAEVESAIASIKETISARG